MIEPTRLSAQIREAQQDLRELLQIAETSPFGPLHEVARRIFRVESLLGRLHYAVTEKVHVDRIAR